MPYCTVKCARQKYCRGSKNSRFFSDSVGLCKAVLMERVAGRMAGKRFEVIGGVLPSIGRESTQTESYIHTKVSLPRRSFGMAIGILASALGNSLSDEYQILIR